MGLLLSAFANSSSRYRAAVLQRAAGWAPPPQYQHPAALCSVDRQRGRSRDFPPSLRSLKHSSEWRGVGSVVQQRLRLLSEMSGIFTIVSKRLCVTWAESVGGAQSPALSFAVSKPPHLRDLMSDTRRLVSIDLSDTWGSCQTHLHSEASTHTSTSTHTHRPAQGTKLVKHQRSPGSWTWLTD